jgi:hypothetical protein
MASGIEGVPPSLQSRDTQCLFTGFNNALIVQLVRVIAPMSRV